MMRLALVVGLLLLLTAPALAFDPAPGKRAYPIVGHDLVSGKTVSLEDYHGK
jgi:hypothetical protein